MNCKIEINYSFCSNSSRNNKFISNNDIKDHLTISELPKREILNDILFKLEKYSEIKHINKFEKNYIIINNNKSTLKGTKNKNNYLINLSNNLKSVTNKVKKRRKCSSTFKIGTNEINNGEKKETILEGKKKQKRNNVNKQIKKKYYF